MARLSCNRQLVHYELYTKLKCFPVQRLTLQLHTRAQDTSIMGQTEDLVLTNADIAGVHTPKTHAKLETWYSHSFLIHTCMLTLQVYTHIVLTAATSEANSGLHLGIPQYSSMSQTLIKTATVYLHVQVHIHVHCICKQPTQGSA